MGMIYKESNILKPAVDSPIREFMSRAAHMSLKYNDVISFSAGEPDFDTPSPIKEATINSLRNNETHYESAYGSKELREAIVSKIKNDTGCTYNSENEIIITSGAAEALNNIILSLFSEKDEVIVLTPAFISYENLIKMSGAKFVEVPLVGQDNYQINIDNIKRATTSNTKAIIINNPCNPTGVVFEKEKLDELCKWVKLNDLIIISDEIYADIVYEGKKAYSIASFDNMKENLILINGFSKTYAMTGWRIGYMVADYKFINMIIKFHTYCTTCAPTFLQSGIARSFELEETKKEVKRMIEEFERRRNLVINKLNETGKLAFTIPYGAFYILVDISSLGIDGAKFANELLEQYHVAVVPASNMGAGCENIIRIAYTCAYDRIEEGLNRINNYIRELSQN